MPSSRRTKTANPENRKRTLDQVNDSVASKRQRLEKLEAECQKQHEQTKVLRADIEKFRSDTLKGRETANTILNSINSLSSQVNCSTRAVASELREGQERKLVVGELATADGHRDDSIQIDLEERIHSIQPVLRLASRNLGCRVSPDIKPFNGKQPFWKIRNGVLLEFQNEAQAREVRHLLREHRFPIFEGRELSHKRLRCEEFKSPLDLQKQIPLNAAVTAWIWYNASNTSREARTAAEDDFKRKFKVDYKKNCIQSKISGVRQFHVEFCWNSHIPWIKCYVFQPFWEPVAFWWDKAMEYHEGEDKLKEHFRKQMDRAKKRIFDAEMDQSTKQIQASEQQLSISAAHTPTDPSKEWTLEIPLESQLSSQLIQWTQVGLHAIEKTSKRTTSPRGIYWGSYPFLISFHSLRHC